MSSSPEISASAKKRKRDIKSEDDEDKLEIDINLPEPPSKKAKRKEKKLAKSSSKKSTDAEKTEGILNDTKEDEEEEETKAKAKSKPESSAEQPAKRSEYGIWIGNLPFHATRVSLRDFLRDEGEIDETSITRVHMPTSEKDKNKGFAYVDFTTAAVLEIALTLSERLLLGRKVLIKNAKSFEGRPAKSATEGAANGNVSGKEPSKRVFVGNLSFDITKDDLEQHFGQAGQVENIHMATFEDSGKCKGFAWVTFADLESAGSAVRGFVLKKPEDEASDSDEEAQTKTEEDGEKPKKRSKKAKKPQKWYINRLYGRELRCEFAEDSHTRYKKRFAGGGAQADRASGSGDHSNDGIDATVPAAKKEFKPKLNADQRQDLRRKKFDARKTAPGRALANTPRASAAAVAGTGSKVTFD